jgi:predicted Zn-dependent peptidase
MFKLSDFGVTRNATTLLNGARVVTFERKGMPVFAEASFFAGARFDPDGKEGVAHFAEHLIASETKKFPKVTDLWSYVERRGGMMNAQTSHDTLGLLASFGDPEDISALAEVLCEEIDNPLFRKEKIDSERQTIQKERGMIESKPDRYIYNLWNSIVYAGHPLGRSVVGTKDSLNGITDQDLRDFYDRFIDLGRMVLVVSGDVSIERVREEFEKRLTRKKEFQLEIPRFFGGSRDKFIAVKKFGGADQVYFNFGFRSCSEFDDDGDALYLLGAVLAGGFNSILYEKLRNEKGLVYSVAAGNDGYVDGGSWLVSSSTSKENLTEALKITVDEIGNLYNGLVTQEQLDFVKDRYVKSARLRTQTASSWVSGHVYSELFYTDGRYTVDKELNKIVEVTLDDLKRVAKKYLQPRQWYFAATGEVEESDISIDY